MSAIRAGLDQAVVEVKGLFNIAIFVAAVVMLSYVFTPLQRMYDDQFRARPFVTASIIVSEHHTTKPTIEYLARADVPVEGRWSAWVSVNGHRTCSGGGESGYGPDKKGGTWDWDDWLGKDCTVPTEPYSLCARYVVRIIRTGVGDVSGPFCSGVVAPSVTPDQ